MKTLVAFALLLLPALPARAANYYEPHFESRMMTIATQTWGVGAGAVLLLGDSNTEMIRPIDIGGCQVINAGFGGARIADIAKRAEALAALTKPSIVHLMIGTNDTRTLDGEPDPQMESHLAETVAAFKQAGAIVVLWTVPPTGPKFAKAKDRAAINAIVRRVAKSEDVALEADWAQPMTGLDGYAKPGWLIGDDVHLTPNGQIARVARIAALDAGILQRHQAACRK